nr:polysaccharide pyruvyl transferase CsaB [Sedimentibacter sp.]
MKNILLAGYYGFGNLGDEAILEMVLKQLLEITDRDKLTVLSGNKEETSKKYDVCTIDRNNVLSIIKRLMTSDALVFGGGSLLQDVTSKRSIYYYLLLIRLAKIMKNKVIMLSQGIGPILNDRSRRITANTLNKVDYITVRDKQSKEFLESIGVQGNLISLSADPVINFRAEDNPVERRGEKKKVCFSLRNWKCSDVSGKISFVTEKLIENNIECHFIPFYYNEDLELVNEIKENIGEEAIYYRERLSTNEAYDIIKNMNLLVGVRLHSLIFAASAGVPFVAVSYDHKVDHFAESVNMNVACCIEDIDTELLYGKIISMLENEDEERKKLAGNVEILRDTISVNYKILKEI